MLHSLAYLDLALALSLSCACAGVQHGHGRACALCESFNSFMRWRAVSGAHRPMLNATHDLPLRPVLLQLANVRQVFLATRLVQWYKKRQLLPELSKRAQGCTSRPAKTQQPAMHAVVQPAGAWKLPCCLLVLFAAV